MNSEIVFTEKQRFTQWWIWLILAGVNGLLLFGLGKQLITGEPFGDNPMSNTWLMVVTGFSILVCILILNFRLETHIKRDGIYVRFYPFHLSFRQYLWNNIRKSFVRTYKPIREYGGWGIRIGFFGKGGALNVSGNKGLQLEFEDGKKLLIGTNKPDELESTLRRIGRLKE